MKSAFPNIGSSEKKHASWPSTRAAARRWIALVTAISLGPVSEPRLNGQTLMVIPSDGHSVGFLRLLTGGELGKGNARNRR